MTYQNDLYVELAKIGKSLSSERRLEIMDLLVQGPKTVEKIAELTKMSVANTSRHLQVLRSGNLVERKRDGNHIYYGPASSRVVDLFYLLRDVGEDQLERISQIKEDFEKNDVYAMSLDAAYNKAKSGEIELIDVRPADEYATAHIAEAKNIPLPELKEKLDTLPADKDVVVYCRGNLCTYATRAAKILSESGYNAHSLNESTYDWNRYIEKEGAGKNEN